MQNAGLPDKLPELVGEGIAMRLLTFLFGVLLLQVSVAQCQQLTIQTETGKKTVLARPDLEAMPHVKIAASVHGEPAAFEGITLKAVLEKAGVEFGETLKGKRLATCLLVEAADGYRVVIALPEIDPAFNDKLVILAFLKDGKPLSNEEGPYWLVIPDEKRMARWVRQVTALKIVEVQ